MLCRVAFVDAGAEDEAVRTMLYFILYYITLYYIIWCIMYFILLCHMLYTIL